MKKTQWAWVVILLPAFFSASYAQQSTLFIERENSSVSLTLTGQVGTVYEILQTDSLTPPVSWAPLTNFQLAATSLRLTQSVVLATSARFYRAMAVGATNVPVAWIPLGVFMMGSPDNEQDRQIFEGPQRTVMLTRGFYMAKYEVTQAEYVSVMHTNPSHFVGNLSRPVETVSWSDATNYCIQLTVRERTAGRLSTNWVYRLPTEAEWEYVARAGTTTRFGFGDDPSYAMLGTYAWYLANSANTTHPVGMKSPNSLGIYDLYGNVAEYCLDWFAAYPAGNVTDPTGPVTGPWHVFRGGNYYTPAPYARSASRQDANAPDNYIGGVGFRVVLSSSSP